MIRLYFDEDAMRTSLLHALNARQIDVVSALDSKMVACPDAEHLAYATRQQRVLFTFNRGDFARLHQSYLANGQHHSGIIVSDQLETGVILRRLLKLLNVRSSAEMQDRLEFLSNWR